MTQSEQYGAPPDPVSQTAYLYVHSNYYTFLKHPQSVFVP